jgi:mannose-6-phosphate isomerase-like protein (cupin superfamily)
MTYSETRPWGWFETILTGAQYQVKLLVVEPNQRLSLQKHEHREEHWVVVGGSGTITVGDESFPATPGVTAYITKGEWHRLEAGESTLKLIEVQRGSLLYEEDITRKSDDYGRK